MVILIHLQSRNCYVWLQSTHCIIIKSTAHNKRTLLVLLWFLLTMCNWETTLYEHIRMYTNIADLYFANHYEWVLICRDISMSTFYFRTNSLHSSQWLLTLLLETSDQLLWITEQSLLSWLSVYNSDSLVLIYKYAAFMIKAVDNVLWPTVLLISIQNSADIRLMQVWMKVL